MKNKRLQSLVTSECHCLRLVTSCYSDLDPKSLGAKFGYISGRL